MVSNDSVTVYISVTTTSDAGMARGASKGGLGCLGLEADSPPAWVHPDQRALALKQGRGGVAASVVELG